MNKEEFWFLKLNILTSQVKYFDNQHRLFDIIVAKFIIYIIN